MLRKDGYQAMITQHSWMFLSSFEKLREKLQMKFTVNMAHLGARAFEEIGGEVVQTTSWIMRKGNVDGYKGTYCRLIEPTTQQGKEELYLSCEKRYTAQQENFTKIPEKPVAYWLSENWIKIFEAKKISQYGEAKTGIGSGNTEYFLKLWHEIEINHIDIGKTPKEIDEIRFAPINKGGARRKWYGNNEYVIKWYDNGKELKEYADEKGNKLSYPRNLDYQLSEALTWGDIFTGDFSMRFSPTGYFFSDVGNSLFMNDKSLVMYTLGYCNTKIFNKISKMLNQTIHFKPGNMLQVPFLIETTREEIIEELVKDCITLSRQDWDSFETSWDFKVHPLIANNQFVKKFHSGEDNTAETSVRAAFNMWHIDTEERFCKLKANEEELNRIFIDIYGLQDELTPEVDDKDVTVRKADLGRDIRSFISYAVGCMFGRYSLEEEGLILAGQPFSEKYVYASVPLTGTGVTGDSSSFTYTRGNCYLRKKDGTIVECSFEPDYDNIIPITDEEYFPNDIVTRFVEFVRTVYGTESLETNLEFIANALGTKGATPREIIRNYFIKDFYPDHVKIYQKRPIYWLFDSGKQNGFKALIYMHRYNQDTVGIVRTDYLHKAQSYISAAARTAQYTIETTNSTAEKSKATKAVSKYTNQLSEIQLYDQAIAHIANKRLALDLDDGVKTNYAKFQGIEVAREGMKTVKIDLLGQIK
jgi:hypothetical protein